MFKRRDILKALAATSTYGPVMALSGMPSLTFSQTNSAKNVVVIIFQRGGHDGLNLLVPTDTSDQSFLQAHRHNILNNNAALFDTGEGFGINPAMAPLYEGHEDMQTETDVTACAESSREFTSDAWSNGFLTFFPGTHVGEGGNMIGNMSHFLAQELMEYGGGGNNLNNVNLRIAETDSKQGWLARTSQRIPMSNPPTDNQAPLQVFGFSNDFSLVGAGHEHVVVESPHAGGYLPDSFVLELLKQRNDSMKISRGEKWRSNQNDYFKTLNKINTVSYPSYCDSRMLGYKRLNSYTNSLTNLGSALSQTAALIKGLDDLQIVTLNHGGYDTHSGQNQLQSNLLTDLSTNLAAFRRDMIGENKSVDVVVLTEFGRTVDENSGFGTDHGQAFCAMVMGAGSAVGNRKKIYFGREKDQTTNLLVDKSWPGLSLQTPQHPDGTVFFSGGRYYFRPIQDYRDILNKILQNQLVISPSDASSIFNNADKIYNDLTAKPAEFYS